MLRTKLAALDIHRRHLLWGALVAVLLVVFAMPATAKKQRVLDRGDRRFDHETHSRLVVAKLGKDEECSGQCHTMSNDFRAWKRGPDDKKEHERCYAGCHKGYKHKYTTKRSALKGITGRTCFPCHGAKLRFRPRQNDLGKVAGETKLTFAATYSHRQHTSGKASTGKQCEACHGRWGDQRGTNGGTLAAGHEYCSACHSRAAEPTMTACDGCHKGRTSPEGKNPVIKPRKASPYAVDKAFSHKSHANLKRVGTKGRTCLTCHANISESKEDTSVPMPTMQDCYKSCHDGKKAFSVTGTKCTACHARK